MSASQDRPDGSEQRLEGAAAVRDAPAGRKTVRAAQSVKKTSKKKAKSKRKAAAEKAGSEAKVAATEKPAAPSKATAVPKSQRQAEPVAADVRKPEQPDRPERTEAEPVTREELTLAPEAGATETAGGAPEAPSKAPPEEPEGIPLSAEDVGADEKPTPPEASAEAEVEAKAKPGDAERLQAIEACIEQALVLVRTRLQRQ